MNNIRHDQSHHWINQDELTKQIDELSSTTSEEHREKALKKFVTRGEQLKARYNEGEDISDEVSEEVLRRRIDAAFPTEHHTDRWARKNKAALEVKGINEKMKELSTSYRLGRLNDSTYYNRLEKLGLKKLELEREL